MLDRQVGTTTPATFRFIIRCLPILGYRIVELEELKKSLIKGTRLRTAVITFDDGFKDLYINAFPFLKSKGIPFTLFANTENMASGRVLWLHRLYISLDMISTNDHEKLLNNKWKYEDSYISSIDRYKRLGSMCMYAKKDLIYDLTEKAAAAAGLDIRTENKFAGSLYLNKTEINEMLGSGMGIECHGHDHLPLFNLSYRETEAEVFQNKKWLKKELDYDSCFLSLAYGVSNKYIKKIARESGIWGILATYPGLVNPKTDSYNIPRILIGDDICFFFRKLALGLLRILFRKQDKLS